MTVDAPVLQSSYISPTDSIAFEPESGLGLGLELTSTFGPCIRACAGAFDLDQCMAMGRTRYDEGGRPCHILNEDTSS